MKKVYFRFYEELNDFLPDKFKKIKFDKEYFGKTSVKDIIESLGVPHNEIDLILVNGNSVNFNYIIKENDEISVYPVFESFNISGLTHLRNKPLREPKFICDVHIGTLVRYLRLAGFDTFYENDISKNKIVQISISEKRTILTKDKNLLKRNDITHGYWIRESNPIDQVKEVIKRFQLENLFNEFSRCLDCNNEIKKIEKIKIEDKIPAKVKEYHNEFYQCSGCKNIYWKGTHYQKMLKILESVKQK